jgi:hypothetical protein
MKNLMHELPNIVSNIDTCISQLSLFISQFNDLIIQNNINVVSDTTGNISIDVPSTMSEDLQSKLAKKVGIIDRLISDRSNTLDELFKQGFDIENSLKKTDPKYSSVIMEKANAFNQLKNTYKH